MFFNNKISVDKGQQKMYNRGMEYINSMVKSDEQKLSEQTEMLNNKFSYNLPAGRANTRRRLNARKFKAKDSMTKKLFKESVFDLYKDSLLIDEDFKAQQEGNLYNLFEETFNSLMNEGYFSWDSIRNNECRFTNNLFALCEETAKDASDKLVNMDTAKKANIPEDALINEKDEKKSKSTDDEVPEEDKKELDEKTKDDKKAVSDVIKDKVINTLKKEKEASEKEDDDDKEIEENSKTEKEKEEEDSVDDSESENSNEEGSDDTEEDKNDDSKDSKKSESFSFAMRVRHPNKLMNASLFRSIQINVANKFMNEKKNGLVSEDVQMNMDMMFAESLSYYTLLETFNTTGITNFRVSDAKNICKNLILK